MRLIVKFLMVVCTITFSNAIFAQGVNTLINEGLALSKAGQHAAAVQKYQSALQAEPGNVNANYQIAFSLKALGKGTDALPYLQKVVTADVSAAVKASAYSLMGNVYEKTARLPQAIDSYKNATEADSANYSLYYNLGLAYFRARQYASAENSALSALALSPDHLGSIRLYALVAFHQNKRAPALLALCRYLSLSPTGASSSEAYSNIQSILSGGTLRAEAGNAAPLVNANNKALNDAIISAITESSKQKYYDATAQLSTQLKVAFTQIGALAGKQSGNSKYFNTLASRFYQMAQTERMPAFGNFISQGVYKSAAAWVKAHADKVSAGW